MTPGTSMGLERVAQRICTSLDSWERAEVRCLSAFPGWPSTFMSGDVEGSRKIREALGFGGEES
jgi:hypothetical protein